MSMKEQRPQKAVCPSARAEPGATLVGVVGEDGRVKYLKDRLEVDQHFIDLVSQRARPEQRFRFANTCVEGGCQQWDGSKCRIVDNVRAFLGPGESTKRLAPCSIRPACRWFRQDGAAACRLCPLVITDTAEPAAEPQPKARSKNCKLHLRSSKQIA